MKRLILMRHAKSDWSEMDATDHERTLNPRGQKSAKAVGDWLRAEHLLPDHVLCSDAARTQETLLRLRLADTPTTITRTLYLAEPDVMASALSARSEDCVLMLAHNPGCGALADLLLAAPPTHSDFGKYPTCATLVADFNISDWRQLRHGTGQVRAFIVPRDLYA